MNKIKARLAAEVSMQSVKALIEVHNRLIHDSSINFYDGELYDLIFNLVFVYGYALISTDGYSADYKTLLEKEYGGDAKRVCLSYITALTVDAFMQSYSLINDDDALITRALNQAIEENIPKIHSLRGTYDVVINPATALKQLLIYGVIKAL